jgi:hypothetical protein
VSQEINYKVNAWLTTKGTFLDQMKKGGQAADDFSSRWSSAGQRFSEVGGRVAGTTSRMLGGMAAMGAAGFAAAATGGMAAMVSRGVEFNNTMEQGALGLATMYQTFGVASGLERNVELAKAFQSELVAIADASPGTTQDLMNAYKAAAPAMSAVTQDLMRQKDAMSKLAVMAWASNDSYQQLGSDFGRIIQGAAGAETMMFKQLAEPIKAAFTEATGDAAKTGEAWSQQWNKAVQEGGDLGLKIMEKVLANVPSEFADAFGKSFGGALASVESKLLKLGGDFSKPLFESIKSSLVRVSSEGGILGADTLGKLTMMADMFGRKVAKGFEKGVGFIEKAIGFLADNWQAMWLKVKQASVITATAIKIAFVVGLTRMVAGSIISGVGAAMRGASTAKAIAAPIAAWISSQTKATGMGIRRGAKGKGRGITGMIGRGAGEIGSGFAGTRKAIVSGMTATRNAFAFMRREAAAIPGAVYIGTLLLIDGLNDLSAKAKGLPALASAGLGHVKLAFAAILARARGLPAMASAGLARTKLAFGSMLAKAATLPATVTAGFTATKTAFVTMAAKARAMGLRGMVGAARAGIAGVGARAGAGLAGLGGRARAGMGRAGAGMAGLFGKGAQSGMMKLATAGTMLVALAGPALILGVVIGGLMVAFGGIAAYISTKWTEISTTLIGAMERGKISLVPLMTALYTFWMRLVMVGEALIGGGDATSTFNGFLSAAVWLVDAASTGLGYFIKGLSLLVGAFGAVKLGITAVVGVVAWMLEMLSKVPKVGAGLADTAAEMRKSQASWMASTQDTFTTSEKLARAADKVLAAKLSEDDMGKAAAKAKALEDRLKGFLSGESKKAKPKGAKVHVDKVVMNIDLQEPDPDRVMALLVKPLQKLATGRTQAYSTTENGA